MAVIVPAHDEEELLGRCLASVHRAKVDLRASGIDARVWVVLDACTDRSALIAGRHDVETVVIDAACVGAAREAGVAAALEAFRSVPPARLWTAHTDADSAVPPHWLRSQVALAAAGADVVVGTVRPDFDDLTSRQVAAWTARHTPGIPNGHVHGANLGMRAATLIGAGGFEPAPEHEDVWLVAEARARGARIVASDEAEVLTSGRGQGRTPGGYARYLREDLIA